MPDAWRRLESMKKLRAPNYRRLAKEVRLSRYPAAKYIRLLSKHSVVPVQSRHSIRFRHRWVIERCVNKVQQ